MSNTSIPMHPVNSSNLSYVGWEKETLYITFHNGKKYRYLNVPVSVYNSLRFSNSPGRNFNQAIKGIYEEEEI